MTSNRINGGPPIVSWFRGVSRKSGSGVRADTSIDPSVDGAEQSRSLKTDLATLISEVDLDSEEAVRRLRRPILRRILLSEFGEGFAEHPDFAAMMDRIELALDVDPAMPKQFLALLRDLKHPSPP